MSSLADAECDRAGFTCERLSSHLRSYVLRMSCVARHEESSMTISISRPDVVLVLAACGHSTGDISSIPIEPVKVDAVYVVNGGESSISVIDVTTDEVVGTIELVGVDYPHHISLSPDRSTLLV